ncbi:MAG: hypothetical protein Q7U66_00710 [Methylobacter sp.]|nr:hypothetical protein [Methylobacter sp.]
MNNETISVIDVAKNFGKRSQSIFKIIGKLGIETVKEKSNGLSRGQAIAYIINDDYARVKEYLAGTINNSEVSVTQLDIGGVFYLIQLEPEHDPGRYKLGFATNIEERLRTHKTAAPFSKVLKTWPCKLLWEKTAIESASQNCVRLHTEVFRSESIDEVQSRCEQFFKLMPKIKPK